MILPLTDRWRVKSDRYCWTLQNKTKRKNKGTGRVEDYWRSETYHATLEQAIQSAYELELRLSEAEGIVDCLHELRRLHDNWCTVLYNALGRYEQLKPSAKTGDH